MKKILLVLLIMSVSLVGCSLSNISVDSSNNDVSESREENTLLNNTDTMLKDEENPYKLLDTYYYDDTSLNTMSDEKCIMRLYSSYDERIYYNEHTYIESDGMMFDIECIKSGEFSEDFGVERYSYDVKINGETLYLDADAGYNAGIKFGSNFHSEMYEIDLDENDQYKEVLLVSSEGLPTVEVILRLTKDGIKLINEHFLDTEWGGMGLCKINNKWIYPINGYSYIPGIIFGYYMYEDGEFKYVKKFATGEDIYDENGMFPENIQKMVFVNGEEFRLGKDDWRFEDGVRFNILSGHSDIYGMEYTIRLLDDSGPYKAETIIEDCYYMPLG